MTLKIHKRTAVFNLNIREFFIHDFKKLLCFGYEISNFLKNFRIYT